MLTEELTKDQLSKKIDLYWMREALNLAHYAQTQDEVPVGAVLVYQDKIIGRGWNQSISTQDPSAHAEIVAIRQGAQYLNNYRLVESTLYVTLEPCVMCVGAIIHGRIKRLVFAAKDLKTGAAGSVFNLLQDPKHNHRVMVEGGLLAEESALLLQNFFKSKRKSRE